MYIFLPFCHSLSILVYLSSFVYFSFYLIVYPQVPRYACFAFNLTLNSSFALFTYAVSALRYIRYLFSMSFSSLNYLGPVFLSQFTLRKSICLFKFLFALSCMVTFILLASFTACIFFHFFSLFICQPACQVLSNRFLPFKRLKV